MPLRVAMYRLRGKRRRTDGNVLGAVGERSGVAHPLSVVRDDRLARRNIQQASVMLNAQSSAQYQSVFIELRGLAWFLPALRTSHVGHAQARGSRVDTTHIFLDDFGFAAGGFNAGSMRDQSRHDFWIVATRHRFEQLAVAVHPAQ